MERKHTRLTSPLTAIILIGLLLACGVGPSTAQGDLEITVTGSTELQQATTDATTIPLETSQGTTYYVRSDGGSTDQCNGLADAAYPGSGTNQPCAWVLFSCQVSA